MKINTNNLMTKIHENDYLFISTGTIRLLLKSEFQLKYFK